MTNTILPIIDEILSFVDKTRREREMLQSIPILRDVMTCLKKILLACILFAILSLPGFSQSIESASALYKRAQSLFAKSPKKAYALFVEAMQVSKQNNDRILYVNAVNRLASLALDDTGSYDDVFTWVKEAVDVFKDAKEDTALAKLHYNLAEFYFNDNQIGPPIYQYEKAKKMWTSLLGELTREVASCYHGLGDVYKYNKFDFQEAEKCYERALFIRERIQLKDTRVLYVNYYSLAATNRSQHDFEKALSYGSKAITMAAKFSPVVQEDVNGMVANIYRDMGQSELAKKYYLTALSYNKKTNDQKKKAWYYYMCLGETLMNDSLYNEALQNFTASYALYKKSEAEFKSLFINLLINMIDAYNLTQDDTNFFKTVKEVFGEFETDKVHSKEAYVVYLHLGDYHNRKRSYDSALFYYQKSLLAAVPLFRSTNPENNPNETEIGFLYYVYEGLAKKAFVLRSKFLEKRNLKYLHQSLNCLMLAEKLISKERNTLDMENAKWEFLESNYDLYEDILSNVLDGMDVLQTDTAYRLAFRYMEQSKSRSLADALTQTEQTKQISNKDSLFRVLADLKRKLFRVQDNINEELDNKSAAKEISKLREEVVVLDRSIQSSKLAIDEKYPGYLNAKYGYQTPALQDIQAVIRKRGQVILEYFWGSKWVYALGIGEDKILFKRIGRPDSIKTIINTVLVHLSEEHSSMDLNIFNTFGSNSHRLYEILVGPFKELLLNKRRIQIIPDGPISQVPFEVLLEEKIKNDQIDYRSLKYMIKSYTVGYAYSSSMLGYKTGRVVRRPSMLAVGFTGGQRLRAADPELEEIQGAEEELEALAKRFTSGKFLVGPDATEANFKALCPDFDIIHLAIHGKGDVQKNFSASLYFRTKYDSLDDGELHAYELYGLKLKAQMAVLSACESGLGKGYKGEGMISMASAFTYSGCENILMSLWKVNDKASTILMDDFYGQLLEGESIDEALRLAKLEYLETADELSADPKTWAPLVAYGSLGHVFQKDRSRLLYTFLSLTIILLLIYFIKKKESKAK